MAVNKIIIGTRGSELAKWQAEWAKKNLENLYSEIRVEIKIIKTQGDQVQDISLSKIGDKGLFTKAIEDELLEGSIDIAVHSLKDLPTQLPEGLIIGAVSKREDSRDVFISSKYDSLTQLPWGATVATGSLRRKSQLLNFRKDLDVIDIRGNITTRLIKFDDAGWDGLILAFAGISRLGQRDRIKQIIPEDVILPAVSQGVIAIETRKADVVLNELLKALNNNSSMTQILAERSLLRTLEGGCQVPIGAYTRLENSSLNLKAMIGSLDGKKVLRTEISGSPSDAEELGKNAGEELLSAGGREILDELRAIK
ncbi:MAG TPA: hydroxymethylbilane synthase [Ignavibacteria bacterium]